ncbi:MAG TPA: hypothetical protein VGY97_02285 [Solirubrobacteraceae bacterium]|jgi:hypothetical protein|nr:hypothetical protein [Solirubrobacteraceae bacterium]
MPGGPSEPLLDELRAIRRVLEDIRGRVQLLVALMTALLVGLLIGSLLAASYASKISNDLGL